MWARFQTVDSAACVVVTVTAGCCFGVPVQGAAFGAHIASFENVSHGSSCLAAAPMPCLVTQGCLDAVSQQHTAWDDLPLGVQQRILVLAGSPCARRVSKAWRDAFDAANDT